MLENIMTEGECSLLRSLIDDAQSIVLCCHQHPDGDALGAMLGVADVLRSLGKEGQGQRERHEDGEDSFHRISILILRSLG